MNPANKDQVLPLILTGPKESADYFRVLDEFVVHTLGENARRHYRIIIDDAAEVARQMKIDAAGERKSPRHRRCLQL